MALRLLDSEHLHRKSVLNEEKTIRQNDARPYVMRFTFKLCGVRTGIPEVVSTTMVSPSPFPAEFTGVTTTVYSVSGRKSVSVTGGMSTETVIKLKKLER